MDNMDSASSLTLRADELRHGVKELETKLKRRSRFLLIGGVALAAFAAVMLLPGSDDSTPQTTTSDPSSIDRPDLNSQDAESVPMQDEADLVRQWLGIEESTTTPPYVDENGVLMSYGERVRFSVVADCTETFVQTLEGDTVPTHDCGPERLEVDHPYGTYTVEQLEYAANEMNDADAAYILAERFASEAWRGRRDDAHQLYMKAFLLTSDSEIYSRMLGEMGLYGNVRYTNGEVDLGSLSANYTMLRVGQMFGAVDDRRMEHVARAANEADAIDLAALDRQANDIFNYLADSRERLHGGNP